MRTRYSIPTYVRAGTARRAIGLGVLAVNTPFFLLGQQEFRPVCEYHPAAQHILFVGDSFNHGRYLPVRTYNNTPGTGGIGFTEPSAMVINEDFDTTLPARMEANRGKQAHRERFPA